MDLDNNFDDGGDKYLYNCSTCNRYNTNNAWCQSCDPQLLTKGWTSGNETIDDIIKSTQLKSRTYHNRYYLQWILYDELKDIEKIGEGGFATIYKATWVNGGKFTKFVNLYHRIRTYGNEVVALKKLNNSQNISDDFLNEVNKFYY